MNKKYIDAEKLIAEIEMYIKDVKDAGKRLTPNMGFFDAKLSGIYDVMNIVASLQQEQSEVDLEKEIAFRFNGKEVSWDELPIEVRKHDYPYYFDGDIDCYPFKNTK